MPFEINTQGTTTAPPPIPKMEVPAAAQAPTPAANPPSNNPVVVGTTTTAPELPFDPNNIIPKQAVEITQMFFITCVIIIIGWPLARAFARFIDRRTEVPKVSGPDITPQIRQLQESVDAMAIELERISESQRFQAKLMAGLPEPVRQAEGKGHPQD